MQGSTSALPEFKPWNSPHLITNLIVLYGKFIDALNDNVPPETINEDAETLKEIQLQKIVDSFSHKTMPTWLALAKSYFPFYQNRERDITLMEELKVEFNIDRQNYDSLTLLIKDAFFAQFPKVNSRYQKNVNNMEIVLAKIVSLALTTPSLLNDAHRRDRIHFDEAAPAMSSSVNPMETILHQMIAREEVDKNVVIASSLLFIQVKTIKANFELLALTQQFGLWQSEEEQTALSKVFKLQKKVKQYYDHLIEVVANEPDEKAIAKLASVTAMKDGLDKIHVFPSQRIAVFKEQLNNANEIKDHRDPLWMRFLRDCLRVLALTFSGAAIYRKLTGQPVNFFKPSHGQCFAEESLQLIGSLESHKN